jgi:hypothetical protein
VAHSRNRPHPTPRWLLLLFALVLLALVATRAVAEPCRPNDENEPRFDDELPCEDLLADEVTPGEDPSTERDAYQVDDPVQAQPAVFASTAFADAAELRGTELSHGRPSRWGRIDLVVAWRRSARPVGEIARRDDAVWMFATWRR